MSEIKEPTLPARIMNKKVNLELVGLDGNAYTLMGAFRSQARKEGWTAAEINAVLTECMSGDYNHLLATLADVCEDRGDRNYGEGLR